MKILVIDDDIELCSLLREFLEREGFVVLSEHSGMAGLDRALSDQPELVILDMMLPELDGFGLLRRLRQKSNVPVIMLTARGADNDRIIGLDLGADDYIPKPFNPKELVARVRAVLRRKADRMPMPSRLEVNGVVLDPATRQVWCDGRPVEMTTVEFDILDLLVRSAGRVLSRDALMESLYNRKATPFDRSIDMHVSHLRRKLETSRTLIKTVRGVGYQFCASPEQGASA